MRPILLVGTGSLIACASLKAAVSSPSIAEAQPEAATPLEMPTRTMVGGKGEADVPYPADFAATVKGDGSVTFPQRTVARIKGSTVFVGANPVVSIAPDASVKGVALKHPYKFDAEGALLDEHGHGVRIAPDGGVRGVGGEWRYKTVFFWTPEGGGTWDRKGWHALEIVALIMIENMLPDAVGAAEGKDAGKGAEAGHDDKGLNIRIPPPSEWFK